MIFAKSHGLDPLGVGVIWTFASGGKIFAYQSAVFVVGYSYGFFEGRGFASGLVSGLRSSNRQFYVCS